MRFQVFIVLVFSFILSAVTAQESNSAPAKKEVKKEIKTEAKNPSRPVFFPASPDEPRLQFLKSFSTSKDFEKPVSGFRKFIVGDEKKTKEIAKPYGVAVHDKKIFVCDTVRNAIVVLDFKTREFHDFEPGGDVQLMEPINLDFDDSGNMYVADARRGQILIFGPDGGFAGVIGKNSEFRPTGILIKSEKIYFCDLKSNQVKVFSLSDRQPLASIPKDPVKEEGKLFSPTNLASDSEGNIYVSDTGAFRVQKYSPSGEYLLTVGSHGDAYGQFARPKGIALDKQGNVFVVDAAFENVQVFDKAGKLLLFFGGPAEKRDVSLVLPAAVALDDTLIDYFSPLVSPDFQVEYLVLVTSQYGDRKLSVFGFGHKKA